MVWQGLELLSALDRSPPSALPRQWHGAPSPCWPPARMMAASARAPHRRGPRAPASPGTAGRRSRAGRSLETWTMTLKRLGGFWRWLPVPVPGRWSYRQSSSPRRLTGRAEGRTLASPLRQGDPRDQEHGRASAAIGHQLCCRIHGGDFVHDLIPMAGALPPVPGCTCRCPETPVPGAHGRGGHGGCAGRL